MLCGELAEAAGGALSVGKSRIADQRGAALRQMGFDRQPLPLLRVVERGEAGTVLVVAADELDVIEDHPDISRVELRQSGKARQEIGLMDRA